MNDFRVFLLSGVPVTLDFGQIVAEALCATLSGSQTGVLRVQSELGGDKAVELRLDALGLSKLKTKVSGLVEFLFEGAEGGTCDLHCVLLEGRAKFGYDQQCTETPHAALADSDAKRSRRNTLDPSTAEETDSLRESVSEHSSAAAANSPAGDADKKRFQYQGVACEILIAGAGPALRKGQKCCFKYVGFLTNGRRFDSGALTTRLGAGDLIKGMEYALENMHVGEKRRAQIPSHLGYGLKRVGKIPPNSDLIFEISLTRICR